MGLLKKKQKAASAEAVRQQPGRHELEHILDELRDECGKAMDQHFQQLIHGYSPDNPIEEYQARELLKSLLGMAVSHRGMIVGRVEAGIEKGSLFDRYYGTLKEINQLTCDATTSMRLMHSAREDYLDKKTLYRHVQEQTYVDFPSDDSQAADTPGPDADLWQSVFPKQAADGGRD